MNSLFLNFVKHPVATGAVCASSEALGRVITSDIGLETADSIVEIGPGTGVFTSIILKRKKPEGRFFAVELNHDIVTGLRANFPGVDFEEGSAEDLPSMMRARNWDHADVIVSSLPWAAFPEQLQDALLASLAGALPPGGVMATFAYAFGTYLPAGRRIRAKLRKTFEQVTCSPVVWGNLPPAFVYRCVKGRN